MDKERHKRISRFLSYVLRHHPESVGVTMDAGGWVEVSALLDGCQKAGKPINLQQLRAVVRENDKQRLSFSDDDARIRASQGYSVAVDLGYEETVPPEILYHGTARKNVESIKKQGLRRGGRHHVHLSPDARTAERVGRRHGKAVVLEIRAGRMHREGHKLYLSAKGVWLTDAVPPKYVNLPGD